VFTQAPTFVNDLYSIVKDIVLFNSEQHLQRIPCFSMSYPKVVPFVTIL
jgi:hypothetical protein